MLCLNCDSPIEGPANFCSTCGSVLRIRKSDGIQELSARLSQLETALPRTNLLSNVFWTRALAVFGHSASAMLVVIGALTLVSLLIWFLISM
jgi:hypothetical protein